MDDVAIRVPVNGNAKRTARQLIQKEAQKNTLISLFTAQIDALFVAGTNTTNPSFFFPTRITLYRSPKRKYIVVQKTIYYKLKACLFTIKIPSVKIKTCLLRNFALQQNKVPWCLYNLCRRRRVH